MFFLLQLNYIRRCGFANDIFYIEVGRSAVTGDGDFWMAVEDNNIALNMNDVITTAMRNSTSTKDEVAPRQRMRSSSANEASKPISVLQRRHTGQKLHGFSPLGKLSFSQICSLYILFIHCDLHQDVSYQFFQSVFVLFIEMWFSHM